MLFIFLFCISSQELFIMFYSFCTSSQELLFFYYIFIWALRSLICFYIFCLVHLERYLGRIDLDALRSICLSLAALRSIYVFC